jgi:hypothetical protein
MDHATMRERKDETLSFFLMFWKNIIMVDENTVAKNLLGSENVPEIAPGDVLSAFFL